MNIQQLPQEEGQSWRPTSEHTLNTWTRIYLHGLMVMAVITVIVFGAQKVFLPLFDIVGDRTLAIVLMVLAFIVVPPLAGSFVLFVIFPLLGKNEAWKGVSAWDDRLMAEVTHARQRAQIVVLNWPSQETRTMGILTSRFSSTSSDGQEWASVYVPTAPNTKLGYIRIVRIDDVEFTDWTLKEWQLYQLTFGAISPDSI